MKNNAAPIEAANIEESLKKTYISIILNGSRGLEIGNLNRWKIDIL